VMISTAPLATDLKLRFKHRPKVISFWITRGRRQMVRPDAY
jgi:hypothetical protein